MATYSIDIRTTKQLPIPLKSADFRRNLNNLSQLLASLAAGTNTGAVFASYNAAGASLVRSSGTFTIAAGNLAANDTITIAGFTLTAVASGATGPQFNIGGSALLTAQNLAAKINATAPNNTYVEATASGTTTGIVTITALPAGAIGNLVTMAKVATNGTLSGATLAGGAGADTSPVTILR